MAPWNPWSALRARGRATTFGFAPLGGRRGWWERDVAGDVILVEESLDRRERRVALAHELVHAERGVGHPVAAAATMQLEEARVDREVARRLVPPDELLAFVRRRAEVGPVLAADVAEEFDVTQAVAELACWLLADGEGHGPVSRSPLP